MNESQSRAAFLHEAQARGLALLSDEALARHTTFRIGGPAECFGVASDAAQLTSLIRLAAEHGVPVFLLGGGSNILVSDRGIPGLVIANRSRHIELMPRPETSGAEAIVVAESGALLARVARFAIRQGWSGLEWAVTIPGTVGGAIVGNAGAFGGDIAGSLVSARIASQDGTTTDVSAADLAFDYRTSSLKRLSARRTGTQTVISATFALRRGDAVQLKALAENYVEKRRSSQPVEPSAGSVFRNPVGDYAGRLIEDAGLKGKAVGGAMVSPKHANFIVNSGGAAADDVHRLIQLIQAEVLRKSGIRLEPEILLAGSWPGGTQEAEEPIAAGR